MFTKKFWSATLERVIRGAAVSAGAVLGLGGTDVIANVDLATVGSAALYGGLGSLVLCLAGGKFGAGDGPAFTGKEALVPPVSET